MIRFRYILYNQIILLLLPFLLIAVVSRHDFISFEFGVITSVASHIVYARSFFSVSYTQGSRLVLQAAWRALIARWVTVIFLVSLILLMVDVKLLYYALGFVFAHALNGFMVGLYNK